MSTMKRFRPKRSFSTPIGGAGRREAELVFGSKLPAPALPNQGPMVALPGTSKAARVPVQFDLPGAALEAMRATNAKVRLERDDALPAGMMRVTYADGATELVPLPKR
jgi:hypothetical protein